MTNDEKMEVMYQMMGELHQQNLDIVFKGALVLEHIMATQSDIITRRTSNDFDIDWSCTLISTKQFIDLFQNILNKLGFAHYVVECVKEPVKNSSGTFNINHINGNYAFSIDLARKQNKWFVDYVRPNGITFTDSSIGKIFCDKLAVLSSPNIIGRPQDIYDLYRISHLRGLSTSELWKVIDKTGRKIYDFEVFLSESDLEHGVLLETYEKYALEFIQNPPDFDSMYGRVRDFCGPFFTVNRNHMEWISRDCRWTIVTHIQKISIFTPK